MDATSYITGCYFLILFNNVPFLKATALRAGTLTCLPVRWSRHIRAERIKPIYFVANL